jgi:hypothetical protein
MYRAVAVFTKGVSNMIRAKTLQCRAVLACSAFILVSLSALADDEKDKDKPALSGVWMLKEGETKLEFSEKNVMTICPHGDSNVIAVICEYTVEREGLVKAKITDFGGKDDAKRIVKEMLPAGTEFTFKWKVTNNAAKLDDLKGDNVEQLKAHLEGEYSQMK